MNTATTPKAMLVENTGTWRRRGIGLALLVLLWLAPGVARAADQVDVPGPTGSGEFGQTVTVLPNGNIVVTDPGYDIPSGATNVGAVYLYDGVTHAQISMLTGSTASDQVGSHGVLTLTTGAYVVVSPYWDNGAANSAGAVTWGSGTAGVSGVVSTTNSLVGSKNGDVVGVSGSYPYAIAVVALSNGNYVVSSPNWDNDTATQAGAVTWGSGTTGVMGAVSAANSLVGSRSNDGVGSLDIVVLSDGNYVVRSPSWTNGAATAAGAVTWGSGTTGVTGTISAANSLVGGTIYDQVGLSGVTALTNGNYVVASAYWDSATATEAGAVTWGNGATGITGTVSTANSLVGGTTNSHVGLGGVTALSNGNYVAKNIWWDNGVATNAGAATWGNGVTGITGTVSAANSLVGSTTDDYVGQQITALTNGNYVVASTSWDGSVANLGAVTWGNGATGITGTVSAANSLIGGSLTDQVGSGGVTELSNGNYVVRSPNYDGPPYANVGAVTWGSGTAGVKGGVNSSNSLIGSNTDDQIGSGGVKALSNGNYVVVSPSWSVVGAADVGAATWVTGTTGLVGYISAANSLVGVVAQDQVGYNGVVELSNGNYVVVSPLWSYSYATTDAGFGAVTWGNGLTGITGQVSAGNSLVGYRQNDWIGNGGITALSNGAYVVRSPNFDYGVADTGAVTWGSGATGVKGAVSLTNSLLGNYTNDQVGNGGVTALSNGNYVVVSYSWGNNGITTTAGAVTWGNGATIAGNISSLIGAGIRNDGWMSVAESSFVANTSNGDTGGLHNNGDLTVAGSAFVNNVAVLIGGGISHFGGTLTLHNSTLYSNTAATGGGISASAALTVTNSTLSGNTSSPGNGGGGIANFSDLVLRNTLIANSNGDADCSNSGTIAENSNNLIEDGSCSAALSGDPLLGVLGDYGGDTQTLPLLPGSPALDAGDAGACLTTDQRGVTRPQGSGCDIGAFESRRFTLSQGGGDN